MYNKYVIYASEVGLKRVSDENLYHHWTCFWAYLECALDTRLIDDRGLVIEI
jgi:hypothetical protein